MRPQRLAAQQPHRALAAIAIGEDLRADDLAVGHAERVEHAVHGIHIVNQAPSCKRR